MPVRRIGAGTLRLHETSVGPRDSRLAHRKSEDIRTWILRRSGWRVRSHPEAMSARKMSERSFFHRSSVRTAYVARVANDLASTDTDAVAQIVAPRCDKVRTQRGFLIAGQEPVASEFMAHDGVIAA